MIASSKIGRKILSATLASLTLMLSTAAEALTCKDVRTIVEHYLEGHYLHNRFTDELSQRTLDQFIRTWDPGKLYFYQKDIEVFKKKYATVLDDQVNKAKCDAIEDIVTVYTNRFNERLAKVDKLIDLKHDFKKDETLVFDRKKIAYAQNTEELDHRWRKHVKYKHLQLSETLKDDAKIREKLKKRYGLLKKRQDEMDSDDLFSYFLNAFAISLDPHSSYLAPAALEDFQISMRLSLEGIGALLRSEDGITTIQSLVPGGAASKTGKVKADDKIVAVAQADGPAVDVVDMELREVVNLIRGPRGTEVRLTLVRTEGDGTKTVIVPIIREKIKLEDRAARSYSYEVKARDASGKNQAYKIGVVDLPSFYIDFRGRQKRKDNYKSSSVDMLREVVRLKKEGVDGIIVDLRSNGGGSLDEAVKTAGLYIDSAPVVQVKSVDGDAYVHRDQDSKTHYQGPLIVLIDKQSASASEIFAGAISDWGRGIIVGDVSTFGKGTVQTLNQISRRMGAIKVTISKFYLPAGDSTQLRGVRSDILLPSLSNELEIGEDRYDYALPFDKIAAVHKVPDGSDKVTPYLATLVDASKKRVSKNEDFKKVYDNIKEYHAKEKERGQVSLKKEKKKEDKKEKEDDEVVEVDKNKAPDLSKDIYLGETVMIMADYIRLLNKQTLLGFKIPVDNVSKITTQKTTKK